MSWGKLLVTLTARSLRHPSLGVDLLRVSWRFRSKKWFWHFPFLPVPDKEYIKWRMYTAYGSADAVPPALDIERYARWAARR